jgi:type II secretory pathway pseudopilin PulG
MAGFVRHALRLVVMTVMPIFLNRRDRSLSTLVITNQQRTRAFSLVEVVLAIAICSFVLVAILGLFTTGLQSTKESEEEIQAANLAATLISLRTATPTNTISALPNFAIPASAMTQAYGGAYTGGVSTNYVGTDGQTLTSSANAAYMITCQAGTNSVTGSGISQVYLMLSWPPQVPSSSAAGRYELTTFIPIR